MEILKIYENQKTPTIILDPVVGHLIFEGSCYPENIIEFMAPVEEWLNKCLRNYEVISENIVVDFKLSYFNSSTYKYLLTFVIKISELVKFGKNVVFLWYYEEDDKESKMDGKGLFTKAGISSEHYELIPFKD